MSTKSLFFISALVLVLAWAAASVAQRPSPTLPIFDDAPFDPNGPEPILGEPVMPKPGSETKQRDHFKPYDTGVPDDANWKYEDLSPKERAIVDRGRDTEGWQNVHDAYRDAVLEQVPQIKAQISASQLGAEHLATIGVVP